MPYRLVKIQEKSYKIYYIIIISLILLSLIYIIISHFNKKKEYFKNNKTYTFDDESYNLGVCSKQCCATQWPVPINLTEKSKITHDMVGKKYYTSNLTCNNGVINTGCVCLNQGSKTLLGNRGFVKKLPTSNGLLNKDHKISAFKIMEDQIPRPLNVLSQTTELIGSKEDQILTTGKDESKFDKIDKYRTVKSEKELSQKFSMPVNNNIITYDNKLLNDEIYNTISGNELSEVDKLVGRSLGENTINKPVSRK